MNVVLIIVILFSIGFAYVHVVIIDKEKYC